MIDTLNKESMMNAIESAAGYIFEKIKINPDLALILGSGLGNFVDQIDDPIIVDFDEIPFFPKATVQGHGGKIYFGSLQGLKVLIFQGRFHYYEGYDMPIATLPIRVIAQLKIKNLILTNACGGVNKNFKAGDLMIIEDHLSMFCPSPLRGAHLDSFGPRFVDMSKPYDLDLIELCQRVAHEEGIKVQKGVYGYWHGPTYETASEIKAFKTLGADVVGMSTVPETIIANSCQMRVLGISCITNMTCIYTNDVTSHGEVMEMAKKVEKDFTCLLLKVLSHLKK